MIDPSVTDDLNGAEIVDTAIDLDSASSGDADHLEYLLALISHRCPEIGPDDLASVTQPDEAMGEMMPVEIADQILIVVMALDDRMAKLEATVQVGNDLVADIWTAMADFTIIEKQAMLHKLELLVESEASTHATLN